MQGEQAIEPCTIDPCMPGRIERAHSLPPALLPPDALFSRWFWRPAQTPVHLGVWPPLVKIEFLPLLVA